MYNILIFAGTTEGRELAEYLSRQEIQTHVCVATEYGGQLLGEDAYRTVHAGRLTADAMCALMEELAEGTAGGRPARCRCDSSVCGGGVGKYSGGVQGKRRKVHPSAAGEQRGGRR